MLKDLENKIRSLFGSKESNQDKTQSPDDGLKKKKNSKIIQIVIISGVVVLGAMELLFPEKKAEIKKVTPEVKEDQTTNNEVPTTEQVVEEVPSDTPTEAALVEQQTSNEEASENIQEFTPTQVPTIEPSVSAFDQPSEPQEKLIENEETPSDTNIADAPAEIKVLAREEVEINNKDEVIPETVQEVSSVKDSELGNQIEQIIQKVEKESLKKSEYAPPPDYSKMGRGLVYNCKDKHWACVEREPYIQCMNNFEWSKNNKKPKECVTRDVYQSEEDCQTVQLYNINMLVKTDFCLD